MLNYVLWDNLNLTTAGTSFIDGIRQELNNSTILSEEAASKLVQNFLLGAKDGIDKYAKNSPLKGIGNSTANLLAKEVNDGYDTFMDQFPISQKVASLVNEILTSATPKIQASLNQIIADSISKSRESAAKESAQLFREVTLSALPWVALAAAVVTGVPLLVLYIYHRAKRDMDREDTSCSSIKKKIISPIPGMPQKIPLKA